jgi:hypothetical protein
MVQVLGPACAAAAVPPGQNSAAAGPHGDPYHGSYTAFIPVHTRRPWLGDALL